MSYGGSRLPPGAIGAGGFSEVGDVRRVEAQVSGWLPSGDDVAFYRPDEPWGELSNFAPFPIEVDGREWSTTEHFFQAQKFAGTMWEERIRAVATPWEAAELGRRRDLPLRQDWERVKVEVMRTALRAKFTQHSTLRELLLATGDRRLIEHTGNDSFWGNGGTGRGRNMLGLLLVELRAELCARA